MLVVAGLFLGSTISRVTSNIGRYYKTDNTDITLTSPNKATFDEPCCKADASDDEEEGLNECGVFAIPTLSATVCEREITIFGNVSSMQDDSDTKHNYNPLSPVQIQ